MGQLQLLQPAFAMLLAALILEETISTGMVVTSVLVVFCVAGARRAT